MLVERAITDNSYLQGFSSGVGRSKKPQPPRRKGLFSVGRFFIFYASEALIMNAIAVSRDFGAGGYEVARALADALGWELLDRELLHRAA